MISTDLGGRGLDIEKLFTIINFEFPTNMDKFIHRSGRTGWALRKGKVVSILSSENENIFDELKEFLSKR